MRNPNAPLKIQIGAQFGKWTVLSFISKKDAKASGLNGAAYLCECGCNKKTQRYKSSTELLKRISTSCGCERWNNAKNNSLKKYGVESATQRPDVQERRKVTNIEKYGVENPFSSREVMSNARSKIDYSLRKGKTEATFLSKYGIKNALSKNSPFRVNFKQTKESIQKTIDTKKTNNKINVLPNGLSVSEFCRQNGVNSQHANSIFRDMGPAAAQKYIENKNTKISTYLEDCFAEMVSSFINIDLYNKNIKIGGKTHRPDFVISDKLHINVDGVLWHSDKYKKDNLYHLNKRECYEQENKQLIQFRSDEIFEQPDVVKSIVMHRCNLTNNKVYGRKTTLREVTWADASTFLCGNHLMKAGPKARAIGLYSKDDLVAIMTYAIKGKDVEIVRYGTKIFTNVIGGLSKLIKEIISKCSPKKIVSFVDLRYGTGKSLEVIGFTRVGVSLGWKWVDKHSKTQNRMRCRADENISELTKATQLGWAKIYDAGQAKYILEVSN